MFCNILLHQFELELTIKQKITLYQYKLIIDFIMVYVLANC